MHHMRLITYHSAVASAFFVCFALVLAGIVQYAIVVPTLGTWQTVAGMAIAVALMTVGMYHINMSHHYFLCWHKQKEIGND